MLKVSIAERVAQFNGLKTNLCYITRSETETRRVSAYNQQRDFVFLFKPHGFGTLDQRFMGLIDI